MSAGTSWIARVSSEYRAIDMALKGAPIPPNTLYPSRYDGGAAQYLTFPGWDIVEQRAQAEGQKDMARVKTAVTSPWVFADVQLIANIFSTSTLIMKERHGSKLEDADNHPLELIWESPNEHLGRSFVMAFWAWSYVLSGKAYLYWVPDQSGTTIKEVWPIPPWMMSPKSDADTFILGYLFKASPTSTPILIPPEMITYSHSVNLFDVRDGLSFLAAAYTEIQADLAASLWNLNFFDANNGVPDGLIGLDPNALDSDVQRVRMELRDFFGGTKRGIAVARSNDLKYQPFGRSQKDMEFGAGREFASKVIGRTLGIPDAIWSELSNRANAEQAMRTLISGAVWPLLVRLSEDMNAQRIGVVQRWYGDQTRAEFKDIRPEDKEAQRADLAAYQPFSTINQLRAIVGQEALDEDDPRGLMLVAEITKGAPLPGTPAQKMLDDLQAAKDEAAAQAAAAAMLESGMDMTEEPPPDAAPEPPPLILGYHIEQGVVSRNEARERLALPPEDETKSQNLRDLQAMLAVVKMATDTGIDLNVAAGLVGLSLPPPAPAAPAPVAAPALPPPDDALIAPIDEAVMPAAKALELWERKAIHDLKAKGRVYRPFQSAAIAPDEHARITLALKAAESIPAIKAAFKGIDGLIATHLDGAIAWAQEATKVGDA